MKKLGKEEAEKAKKAREKVWKEFFFFARRWSQLSTSVISPSLNLFAHQVHRYHSSGASFQMVVWSLFSFVPLLPAAQRKTVTEMPTVTSLSKRMRERSVFGCHAKLFLFYPFSFPSTHIMTRLRAVALAAVMSLALLAQGGLVRFGERGSRRVKWFRLGERGGDDYQGFK